MTGKTNLLCHAMLKMTDKELAGTGFVIMSASDSWDVLDAGIREMQKHGVSCVLIDEITEVKSFISKSADLANVFSNLYGIRIVCSGSGSLALYFAEHGGPSAT